MATYDPKSIANFFIEAAAKEDRQLTPPELMKLVYLAHCWYLGATERPLLNEAPEAWEVGPVLPSLYHALTIYGSDPVPQKIPGHSLPAETQVVNFLQSIWETYNSFDAAQLTTLTNQPGTPWATTWEKEGKIYSKGIDIPEGSIQAYYRELNANVNAPQPAGAAKP